VTNWVQLPSYLSWYLCIE